MSEFTPEAASPSPGGPSPVPPVHRLPADYYSASPSEVRPIFPRWVPLGCGAASAILLLLAFGGAAVVARYGTGRLMDRVLGMVAGEMSSMYAADVTNAQKTELEQQVAALRVSVRSERLAMAKLEPAMTALREAVADSSVTRAEADELIRVFRETNAKSGERPRR